MICDELPIPPHVARTLHHFTGRTWVLPRIADWLDGGARTLLIKGAPGTGKSMLAAWLAGCGPAPEDPADRDRLAAIRASVRAAHFCRAGTGSVDPRRVVRAVAAQLARTLPGFGEALAATTSERVAIDVDIRTGDVAGTVTGVHVAHLDMHGLSGEAGFNRVLRDPLQRLAATRDPGPILILIDALDEAATYTGAYHLPYLLAGLGDLPPQVRVLATTRPHVQVARYLPDAYDRALDLLADAPDRQEDVQRYVRMRLDPVATPARERAVKRITAAAGGIFLYAHLVVEEATGGDAEAVAEGALPEGLGGLYQRFLNREIGIRPAAWYDHYRPVLGALAVAQGDGLTRQQLAAILGRDVALDRALEACTPYLSADSPDGPFRPFHQSFVDFLLDGAVNPYYRVDAVDAHRTIAEHVLDCRAHWAACDDYGLRYGLLHMAQGRMWAPLRARLQDFGFLEAQGSRLGLNAMLLSLNAVVSHLNLPASALDDPRYRERRDCREQAKRLLRVLDREAHNLRDWDPARLPAAFAQQVYNRAVYEGFPGIREAADRRLRHLDRPCFTLNWRTQHEPAALLRSLDLPRAYAMALVQLPNGGSRGRVLSVGTDRVLQLWRTDTGARLAIFPERHTATIRDLAVTSDGRYALSASFDTTVGVWDLAAGRRVATLAGHTGRLRAVRVTPDDRYAISAGEDNILRVWDLRAALAGEPVSGRVLAGHTGTVWSVAVAPDGRRAASVGDDGRLLLWDLDGGDAPIAQKRTDTALRAVTFLPGQNQVLVGDIAGQLVRLDLDRDTQLALQRKHTSSIFAIAVAGDGSLALTASYDRTVKVWDLREGSLALLHTLSGHGGYVYDVVLSPDGRRAVSAASDGMLKVWQLTAEQTPKRARHPRGHQGTVRSLALMPGAGAPVRAVSSAQDGVLQGWDVEQGRRRYAYRPDAHPPAPHYEVVAPVDGTTFAASALDTTLILRSAADGRAVRVLRRRASAAEPASNEVRGLALAPDRRRVASAAADGRLTLWDLETGASLRTSEAHDDVARVVRFGPDGETLLSGGDDGALKVWDPHDGTLRATCPPPGAGPVRGIAALSADEVLVGYQAGLLAIWRVGQARTVSRMRTPGDGIRGLVVTAGARCVLVAEDRRTLRAWSVRALRAGRAVPDEPLALVRLETGLRSLALDPASGILLVGDVVGGVTCLRYARGAT